MQTLEDSYIYEILCLGETKMNLSKIIIFSSFILKAFLIVDHSKQSHSYYLSLTIKSQCVACCLRFSENI